VPVRGGFKDGIGVFIGDDTLDGGVTWETHWHMDFSRVAGA
jgi:hypothetical protein